MKHVEVSDLTVFVALNRREKLLRWAELVRKARAPYLYLYHNLEYMTRAQLQNTIVDVRVYSAFSVAIADPEFKAQGLGLGQVHVTVQNMLDFFELTVPQAHAFACDCGGDISNEEQARRIERLA
jgi:hypothetical protein